MLKKNIYITYPAGYGGSYIHWALNKSDNDRSDSITDDPVNPTTSTQWGGAGTSHHNIRIPTHHVVDKHLHWIIYNKPQEPLIYLTNVEPDFLNRPDLIVGKRTSTDSIFQYMMSDPDGIFINIHDESQFETIAYGAIQSVTKWPTFMAVYFRKNPLHTAFDPFNCSSDRNFRNAVVTGDFLYPNPPVDYGALEYRFSRYSTWYDVRNEYQPHEVNDNYYIHEFDTTNRIFEISTADIASDKFPSFMHEVLSKSNVSDNWDTSFVENYHHNYTKAQANLQWFTSFKQWKETGELDEYLTSHAIIEAQLIKYMLQTAPEKVINWEELSIQKINELYQN